MYWYYIQESSIQLNSQVLYGFCNKKSIKYDSFHTMKNLLVSAIKRYVSNSENIKKKDEILQNLNLVLQKKVDINSLNFNKTFWHEHNLYGLFILINIQNNQIINSNEAKEFLISFNKISKYIDHEDISRFEDIFKESIKSNSNITFQKKSEF